MKFPIGIGLFFFVLNCSNVELVDYWKNPDIDIYSPKKVLLIGLTSNSEVRQQFEDQLKQEYEARGVSAQTSFTYFKSSFTTEKKTEEELNALEDTLIQDGFDTILFAKLIGSEDKIEYKKNYDGFDSKDKKFKEDFLKYQDAFYNPDYYNEYTIYHTETSLYCICPTHPRELIWKGYFDISDPESINETVHDYARLVILILEEQQLISPDMEEYFHEDGAIQ
ncbi:hypothetical protein [Aestuariivivens sediminis]|uniref:hypothetical protein n=1 Tax=Aestuariivivens sediminis TaxID=2913557 RepID=UPI001F56AB7A|nr:hypothetical protein [Aestuariivivens sediminis]